MRFASVLSIACLLLIYGFALFFSGDNRVEFSRNDLYRNVDFTKRLFENKKIDKIIFDIDSNDIFIYFPENVSRDVVHDLSAQRWKKCTHKDYIQFSDQDYVIHITKEIMQITDRNKAMSIDTR